MVIISVGGGLGNQMFQYAFYLSMVEKYPQTEFKVDIKYAFKKEHNGFELDKVFGIQPQQCTLEERKKLSEMPIKDNSYTRIIRRIRNKLGVHKKGFFEQKDYTEFYPEVYNLAGEFDRYLLGAWANEKYFCHMREKLQKEIFVFDPRKLNNKCIESKKIIEATPNSVSVHVRKGDFVTSQNHVMGKAYYKKAMELTEQKIGEAFYFVFSDDMEYAKELFQGMVNVVFIDGNREEDSWMDMYLMSLCKNHIIANSSFSFWGAYLNANNDKVVVAPNIPFRNCKNAFVCKDWDIVDESSLC